MADRISISAANAACNALTALLDAGATPAYIEVRSGAQPASVATAASGTLLATLVASQPAFDAAGDGVATAFSVAPDNDTVEGEAGWFRAYDGDGVAITDGSVGTSGASMNLNTTSFAAGGICEVTYWTIAMPTG